MALTITPRGTGTGTVGSQTADITPTSNFTSNSTAVLVISYDNAGANGADGFVADEGFDGPNGEPETAWIAHQTALRDPGAANAGAVSRMFSIQLQGGWTTAQTVLMTAHTAGTKYVYSLWEVTGAAPGGRANYVTGGTTQNTGTGFTMTTGSILNRHAVICGIALEDASSGASDTDTTNGTWSTAQAANTTGGGGASNMGMRSQYKIVTATATQTWNFTVANTDWAATWIELSEMGLVSAQAQATIKAFNVEGVGQAQAQIKQTYNGFAQAQTQIITVNRGYGQAQADIFNPISRGYAQAQARIHGTNAQSIRQIASNGAVAPDSGIEISISPMYENSLGVVVVSVDQAGVTITGGGRIWASLGQFFTAAGVGSEVIVEVGRNGSSPTSIIGDVSGAGDAWAEFYEITNARYSKYYGVSGDADSLVPANLEPVAGDYTTSTNQGTTSVLTYTTQYYIGPPTQDMPEITSGQVATRVIPTTHPQPITSIAIWTRDGSGETGDLGSALFEISQVPMGFAQAQALIKLPIEHGQAHAVITTQYKNLQDTFTRTVGTGWGTPDVGPDWLFTDNEAESSVSGGYGRGPNFVVRQQQLAISAGEFSYDLVIDNFNEHYSITTTFGTQQLENPTEAPLFAIIADLSINKDTEEAEINFGVNDNQGDGNIEVIYNIPVEIGIYRLKFKKIPISPTLIHLFIKFWKLSDPEPEWISSLNSNVTYGNWEHLIATGFQIMGLRLGGTEEIKFDQISFTETNLAGYAQAQAYIEIAGLGRGYAQAQADIKQTYNRHAQAQAQIKQTYNSFAQAQGQIKQTYNAFAQAQAQIKQIYNGYAQAQAQILQTYSRFAQAQAYILGIEEGYAQAAAYISGEKVLRDTFTRVESAGSWGSPDIGGDWVVAPWSLNTSNASVNGSTGILITDTSDAYIGVISPRTDLRNLEGFVDFSFNSLPLNGDIRLVISTRLNSDLSIYHSYLFFELVLRPDFTIDLNISSESSGQVFEEVLTNFIIDTDYRIKVKVIDNSNNTQSLMFGKVWKLSDSEPEWVSFNASPNFGGHLDIEVVNLNDLAIITSIDNVNFQESILGGFAQAQALITKSYDGYAQAQSSILATSNGFAQAQTRILTSYQGYAQSQAAIKQTYNSFAQAQVSIKQVYNEYAQAQLIVTDIYEGLGQAQLQVKQVYNGFAQAQLDTKQIYHGFGQAQLQVKQIYFEYAQTQLQVKQTYRSYAQAQLVVLATYSGFAQAQLTVLQIYNQYAQAQLSTKTTYNNFAQANIQVNAFDVNQFAQALLNVKGIDLEGVAQAQMKVNAFDVNAHGQAQLSVLATYQSYAQAQMQVIQTAQEYGQAQLTILQTYFGFAQAQLAIEQTYNQYGQAQLDVKQEYQSYGQAQLGIKQVYDSYAQAQISTLTSYQVYAQAQLTVIDTYEGFSQAQLNTLAVYHGHAQAQLAIKQIYQGYANAQLTVLNTYHGFGQAQVSILTSYQSYGQAQLDTLAIYNSYAQAALSVKQIYQGYGQAQFSVLATLNVHAQAELSVILIQFGFGQAQLAVTSGTFGFGQAQLSINLAGIGFSQAQLNVLTTYRGYAQAQLTILATYNNFAQANLLVVRTEQGHGQSQTSIKQVYRGYAQALLTIKAVDSKYAQAQLQVLTSYVAHAQAQLLVKVIYQGYAQTELWIGQVYRAYAQAQISIKQGTLGIGQAQLAILQAYLAHGNAQALVVTNVIVSGQAQLTIAAKSVHGQAQLYVEVLHTIKRMTISDRNSLNITLTDKLRIAATVTNKALEISATDRRQIRIQSRDRA